MSFTHACIDSKQIVMRQNEKHHEPTSTHDDGFHECDELRETSRINNVFTSIGACLQSVASLQVQPDGSNAQERKGAGLDRLEV